MECRDSLGVFNESVFSLWTCSLCYMYLFPNKDFKFNRNHTEPGLVKNDEELHQPYIKVPSTMEFVCESLGVHDCARWTDCCKSAEKCCSRQKSVKAAMTGTESGIKHCPRTWDGWSCFDDTLPGQRVDTSCPGFIKYGSLKGHVTKECTSNGTWALHPLNGREWTDYSKCVNIKGFKGVVYASALASTFSLLLLIPATVIFLSFRDLRSQPRIQLHICLFFSFVLTSILTLFWELLVYDNRIDNPWKNTFMVQQEESCKVIYILLRYARCTNFCWMFCEGLFLHRLLAEAFRCPRHIKLYLGIGWGAPMLPVAVYAVMRQMFKNDICWVKNAAAYEWILYSPNLLCILVNLVFLLGIVRILLTQLHQHPNEPSNYRRALKATFVLIPLFGLQLFFVIYRPYDASIQYIYEISSKLIIDSQGGLIALVFCYFNGEVLMCIKGALRKRRYFKSTKGPSFATAYTVVTQKGNGSNKQKSSALNVAYQEHIPMQAHFNGKGQENV